MHSVTDRQTVSRQTTGLCQ